MRLAALFLAGLALLAGTNDDRAAALEELRAWSELDLVAELVPRGRELVAEGGPLADSGEAVALVARALADAGLEQEARALLLGRDWPEAELGWIELERVRLHLAADELESARRLLTRPRRVSDEGPSARGLRRPELDEAWLLLARVHARAGDLDRAAPLAKTFLDRAPLHPGAPTAWHLLARAALEQRDGEAAQTFLARAEELERWHQLFRARRLQVRRAPDEPLPRLGLGLAWMQVGEVDRAREVLEDLCARHPDFARGWTHLGDAARVAGDLDRARFAYDRALEVDASQHAARFHRARIDRLQGRADAALEGFAALLAVPAVEADPRYAEAHRELAELYQAAGDSDAARHHRERFTELAGTR